MAFLADSALPFLQANWRALSGAGKEEPPPIVSCC
jgi:hypothetical protein